MLSSITQNPRKSIKIGFKKYSLIKSHSISLKNGKKSKIKKGNNIGLIIRSEKK